MQKDFNRIRDVFLVIEKYFHNSNNLDINDDILESKAEEQNKRQIDYASKLGDYDLVIMTTHKPTCEICAKYQGRVYAITPEAANGKYRLKNGVVFRFPYLYETAFKNGKNEIHPNCRHRIAVFPIRAYTDSELIDIYRNSIRPFIDDRPYEEKLLYDILEAKQNIQNEQRIFYGKLKQTFPIESPKTFSGFVKMENSQSKKYLKLINSFNEQKNSFSNHIIKLEELMEELRYNPKEVCDSIMELNKASIIQAAFRDEAEESNFNNVAIFDITYEGKKFFHAVSSNTIWEYIVQNCASKEYTLSDLYEFIINNLMSEDLINEYRKKLL